MAQIEKQHEATAKQRQRFVSSGDVARSRELTAAFILLGGLWIVFKMGPAIAEILMGHMRGTLQHIAKPLLSVALKETTRCYFHALSFFFAATIGVIIVSNMVQSQGQIQWRELKFDLTRIKPLSRLMQMFSFLENGKRVGISLIKVSTIGIFCLMLLYSQLQPFFQTNPKDIAATLEQSKGILWYLGRISIGLLLCCGIADYFLTYFKLEERMRMTHQEVTDEAKEDVGDPKIRSRRRQKHRDIIKQRSLKHVPQADVVIVNPSHYAVAIAYKQERMQAPMVVGKGADLFAERIRAIARKHGIPVISQPPLCRLLYRQVPVGKAIPQELYHSVAIVLAHVYRIRRRVA